MFNGFRWSPIHFRYFFFQYMFKDFQRFSMILDICSMTFHFLILRCSNRIIRSLRRPTITKSLNDSQQPSSGTTSGGPFFLQQQHKHPMTERSLPSSRPTYSPRLSPTASSCCLSFFLVPMNLIICIFYYWYWCMICINNRMNEIKPQ